MQLPEPWIAFAERLAPGLPPDWAAVGGLGLLVGAALGLLSGLLLGLGLSTFFAARGQRRLQDRFASLSNEALDRNSERLLALAGERLGSLEHANLQELAKREAAVDALVRPLRESLSRVDEKLQKVETEREGHYQSLTKHLELVATSHRDLEKQTRNLTHALRTPNVRGRWGELQLRRVVELAGMLAHCDFQEQVSIETDAEAPGHAEGKTSRARPDLIVRLPGDRLVVIDAKAPLQAYLAASEATDPAERDRLLDEHARHVRRHLDDLGARAYWSRLEQSPEFVVLFLPGEPFFASALARDPELIERGVDRKVLLAGPTTLIALLRAIAYGWQQEEMAKNAVIVSKLGRELFDRIHTLNERFQLLGKKLDGAVEAYNTAMGSFESRVQVSARRMAELGVAQSAELPSLPVVDRRARALQQRDEAPSGPENRTATSAESQGVEDIPNVASP
ncbi:MAG: DNA recombination protein RmuC [Myxococcota bacterium]